jgi:uncharacterized protein (DUF488 family)
MKIVTLGVYGFTEHTFREALEHARPDVFVDIRRRRGVRGHDYAFANSQRLQALLEALGTPYVHRIDLATPEAAIKAQDAADHAAGIRRHDRDHLGEALIAAYQREVLDHFDSQEFVASLGNPESLLLFCVERVPTACHRSLLAARLAHDLEATIDDIVP